MPSSAARDVTLYFVGTLLTQIITFVTGISVARWLGPTEYGALSIARNFYQALAILAPLGFDLSLLRHLGENRGDWSGSLNQVGVIRVITAAVNVVIVAAVIFVVAPYLQNSVYRTAHIAIYIDLCIVALPFAADILLVSACLRSLQKVDLQNIILLFIQPVVRTVALLGMVAAGLGVYGIAVSTAIAAGGSAIIMSWALIGIARKRSFVRRAFDKADGAAVRKVASYSTWLAVMMFLYNILRSVDVLILGRFRPAAEVGAYAALSTIAYVIQIYPFALGQSLTPRVARLYAEGDLDGMRKALSDYLRIAVLLTSPIFAGVAVFGPWLDLLFGSKYRFSPTLSLVLAFAYLIAGCLGQMGVSLTMTGRHKQEFAVLVVGTALAVASCFILAPSLGSVGVALGIAAGYIFTNVGRAVLSARFMGGVDVSWSDVIPPLTCLCIAYVWKAVLDLTLRHTLAVGIVGAVTLLAVYAVFYWLVLFRPDEKVWVEARVARLVPARMRRSRA